MTATEPVTTPLDAVLLDEVDSLLDLRPPNRSAVESLVVELWRHYDQLGSTEPFEAVIDSATGVGKTYIMAAAIEYLARARGVRDFVIVAPGRTILTKTIENFGASGPRSLLDRMTVPITLVTSETFDSPEVARAMDDPTRVKVYVFTVQALVRPRTRQGRRTHEFREGLGAAFYRRLQDAAPLVVLADEHHVYYGDAFGAAVRGLGAWALVGLTATPHRRTPPEQVIYRYPLAAAIAERYVKTPVVVGRRDDRRDPRTKLLDGVTLLDAKRRVADQWADARGLPRVNPIMLVVASDTEEANAWADVVRADDFAGGRYRDAVLVVHSNVREDEEPQALERLARVESLESPVRVVISVSMLKEGWDVKNVYVLLSTRPMLSDVLTEQVLGRGLRLPWGVYTGVEMLDTLEVLAHDRYEDLLRRRDVLVEAFIDHTTRALVRRDADGQLVVERETEIVNLPVLIDDGAQPPAEASTGVSASGTSAPAAPSLRTVEDRGKVGDQEAALAAQELAPRRILRVPLVRALQILSPFSLSDITDLEPFRRLGDRLRTDPVEELRRSVLSARVVPGPNGTRRVETVATPAVDRVAAQGSLIPSLQLRADLAQVLLALPVVAARADRDGVQRRGAERILGAFFDGLNGGADELLSAYLQRASGRLAELVLDEHRRFASRPRFEERVEVVDFGPTRTNTRPVRADRLARPLRGVAFEGWRRGLYALAWFDSGTERDLAVLVDDDDTVDVWVRLHRGDLPVIWSDGTRRYNPDFVVVDRDGTHWLVEVKADDQLSHEDVQAKRAAARRWVTTVNDSGTLAFRWGYLLAAERDVRDARGSWAALKRLAG